MENNNFSYDSNYDKVSSERDYYSVLNVSRNAKLQDIRTSYFILSRSRDDIGDVTSELKETSLY